MKNFPLAIVIVISLLMAGCATRIHPRDETIVPSKTAFSEFRSYWFKPVGQAPGIRVHPKIRNYIEDRLRTCMQGVFVGLREFNGREVEAEARPLVIEPVIVKIKKVSVAKRIFLGFFPGSSAVLMKVRFIDRHADKVIAEPVFYAKSSAMAGAFTFGVNDNRMLNRVTERACGYSREALAVVPARYANAPPETDIPRRHDARERSTGSGFIVSDEGHILTNLHVVRGCRVTTASTAMMVAPTGISVRPSPGSIESHGDATSFKEQELRVIGVDNRHDLALLAGAKFASSFATFRAGGGVRAGDDIVVTGFPLHGIVSSEINVTTGIVSALAGPGDDRHMIQISAPLQPGSSGGPVLDVSGNVIGVVVGKLDAIKTARATGMAPENVSFAVNELTARAFLDAHDVPYLTARPHGSLPTADIVMKAKGYTVLIECRR